MRTTTLSRLLFVSVLSLLSVSIGSQAQQANHMPVIVSVRVTAGSFVYRVDRKIVENTRKNSLLTNLEEIASRRGLNCPIIIIVDENAPLSEIGKLETAADKIDFTRRRLFIADFHQGTMEELHWGGVSMPIPSSAQ